MRKGKGVSRREFLGGAATLAALTIVPRHVVAAATGTAAPSTKINMAVIGAGNQGSSDLGEFSRDNGLSVVALCDVDWKYAKVDGTFKKFPNAKKYKDFRKMFDEMEKGIDAVLVATPDHNHAIASMAAMKRGKHVYCEKPLAHSLAECRAMAKLAKEKNLVTQLGNQGHSYDTCRMFNEWIQDGAIGKVSEIHIWNSGDNSAIDQLGKVREQHTVPDTLDWDLWLGPAALRPYNPMYLPYEWRRWVPFGDGTIGDWTCHIVDPVFWAFDLGSPTSIQSQQKGYDPKTMADTFPRGAVVTYEFAAKGTRGPITMKWFYGSEKPPRPADLEANRRFNEGGIVYGDKGTITYGPWGAGDCRIIPETKMQAYKRPAPTLPRARNGHYMDFLQAIRNGTKAGSDFSYGGPLTEIAMLGNICLRTGGAKLLWDAANSKFTNSAEATAMLTPTFRAPWTL